MKKGKRMFDRLEQKPLLLERARVVPELEVRRFGKRANKDVKGYRLHDPLLGQWFKVRFILEGALPVNIWHHDRDEAWVFPSVKAARAMKARLNAWACDIINAPGEAVE